MSLDTYITDGIGSKTRANVTADHALVVSQTNPKLPEPGSLNKLRYYSSLLGSTGADSGTTNQNVSGAVTEQEFYIAADEDFDIRVMKLVIFIGDNLNRHNKFGNVNALSNGWDLKFTEGGVDTFVISAAATGGEVIQQSGPELGYGDGTATWELSDYNADSDDATLVSIPMFQIIPGGLRIGQGTKDRITSVIKDDLTGLVDFTVRVIGYRHYL